LYTVVDETFVRRPWKHFQTTFYELEYDQLRADLQAKEEALLPSQGDLAAKIRQAQAALEGNAQYRKARDELERVRNRLADVLQDQQFAKSRLDAEYYQYKKAEHEGDLSTAVRYKARVDQLEQQVANLEIPVAEFRSHVDTLQREITDAAASLYELEEERRIRLSDYQRIRERMDDIMRPILPGIRVAKTPEIQQIVLTAELYQLQRAADASRALPNLPHGH